MSEKQPLLTTEIIENRLSRLGETVKQRAIVVGSSAVYAALPDARQPNDIDVSVPPDVYSYLRSQPGWRPKQANSHVLTNGEIDTEIDWETQTHSAMRQRSWQTPGGLRVAHLADVYAYKQTRDNPQDVADTAFIRQRLHDPMQPPLSPHVIWHEIEAVRRLLPEQALLHEDVEAAAWVAANGLATVYTLYGHPDIGRSNYIVGSLELPEYYATATYHNGFDMLDDLYTLKQHLQLTNASPADYLLAFMAESYSDSVYGNGRKSHHPKGTHYDEWLSANLLYAHARHAGFSEQTAKRLKNIILDTSFNEETKKQHGTNSADALGRAVVGVDLAGLSRHDGPLRAFDITVEDSLSARYSPARILGKVAAAANVRFTSTEQAIAFISEHPQAYPPDGSTENTLLQMLAKELAHDANFYDPATGLYVPPRDWSFDRPTMRRKHAEHMRDTSHRLLTRDQRTRITPLQALELAHEYVDNLKR